MTQQKLATTREARPDPETPAPADPLHVLLKGDMELIEATAQAEGLDTVAWLRQTLIDALDARDPRVTADEDTERTLRAIIKASRHSFPTADIEDMLRETEAGRWVRW